MTTEDEKKRRRSRVLEHFEKQEAQAEKNAESGGDENPFQDIDSAFGLDFFDSKGNE